MNQPISLPRLVFLIGGLIIFIATLFFGKPLASGNTEALRILVMAFSILAGFIIAAITMSGDPKLLYPGSWRIASEHKGQLKRALRRYQMLFYVYLIVIVVAFLVTLLGAGAADSLLVHWLERIAIGLGFAALFWSFGLPTSIIRIQLLRFDEEINTRRDEEINSRKRVLSSGE